MPGFSQRRVIETIAVLACIALAFHFRERLESPTPIPSPTKPSPRVVAVPTPALKPKPLAVEETHYSIAGIYPGMTLTQVSELHGKPKSTGIDQLFEVGKPAVAYIVINEKDTVSRVSGKWLQRNGEVVLRPPLDANKIEAVLGRPEEQLSNQSWCADCYYSEAKYSKNLTVVSRLEGINFFLSLEPLPRP